MNDTNEKHEGYENFMMRRLRETEQQSDNIVNNPPHYNQGDIECIDAIQAALGTEGFMAYCRGNIIKYNWRAETKAVSKTSKRHVGT